MRVFVFANRGHGSAILADAIKHGTATVTGVCSRPPKRPTLRQRLGRLRRNDFQDVFAADRHPFEFTDQRFPSRDLEAVERFLWNDRPDVVLCCGFHRRLPLGILNAPTLAAINIHAGLLPERGGGTPTRWAIRDGDAEIGVTAQLMAEDFDAGPIIWQERIPLPPTATQGDAEMVLLRPLVLRAWWQVSYLAGETRIFDATQQTPRMQPPYRGEAMNGAPNPAACRAMLPKACPYGRRECRNAEARPCGVSGRPQGR